MDCVRERKSVIHNDYRSLEHKKGMPEGHAEVVRELVAPVMREGKVVAILGVGNKPVDYTEKDAETVSYLADVTWEIVERKRAEAERVKLEAQNRQLQKAESLSRMAGAIAHLFDNHLAVAMGNLELALMDLSGDAAIRGSLIEAMRAVRRSSEVSGLMLTYLGQTRRQGRTA